MLPYLVMVGEEDIDLSGINSVGRTSCGPNNMKGLQEQLVKSRMVTLLHKFIHPRVFVLAWGS